MHDFEVSFTIDRALVNNTDALELEVRKILDKENASSDLKIDGIGIESVDVKRDFEDPLSFNMHVYVRGKYLVKDTSVFDFGTALQHIKDGKRVCRSGWNGKDMFIFLVQGSTFTVNRPPLLGIYPDGTKVSYQSHIDMKTADNTIVPWLASQSDVLAEDWMLV